MGYTFAYTVRTGCWMVLLEEEELIVIQPSNDFISYKIGNKCGNERDDPHDEEAPRIQCLVGSPRIYIRDGNRDDSHEGTVDPLV